MHSERCRPLLRWLGLVAAVLVATLGQPLHASPRIVIVGDSTASHYESARYPRTGWGQVLTQFLTPQWVVLNRAVSGRSTRSYRELGHFDKTMAELRAGDLLLIQFGHNDQKLDDPTRYADPAVDFPAGLRAFLRAARSAGATPVLLTPVARRDFDEQALPIDTHLDYAEAVRAVARSEDVPMIDLGRRSMDWLEALGPEASKAYYLHDPEVGLVDDTHFHRRGAIAMACLVVAGLVELELLKAADTRRDIACGVGPDQRQRRAQQRRPSLIEHADAITRVQPGPHGGDGLTVASPFFESADGLELAFRRRVLHEGASIGLHAHGKDEIYYVISGRGELSLDGRSQIVGPGMAILTRDGSSHSLRQLGDQDLTILIVYTRE